MAPASSERARSEPAVVRVRGLSVNYGPVAVLQAVDLDVRPGEVVGVAGENGAGKSTLLRCLNGDLAGSRGVVWLDGEPIGSRRPPDSRQAPHSRGQIGVVWQYLELSDNLDAAANLMLGLEHHWLLGTDGWVHARARAILDDLGISIPDTTRPVGTLTTGQRQLLAIARAVTPRPGLLLLDEPTAALDHAESAHVEGLVRRFRDEGCTIVLVSHDVEQLLRLVDRVVVLRHGRVVAQVDPARSHPDELLALMSGHDSSSAPRHQLNRLHGLVERLRAAGPPTSDAPSTGLDQILSTLGAALGSHRLSLHLVDGDRLRRAASVGLPAALDAAWDAVLLAAAPEPLRAAATEGVVGIALDVARRQPSSRLDQLLAEARIGSWWAVPFFGSDGVSGVISVFRAEVGPPARDELDLVNLYAGYAAGSVERDRLLGELTARNELLETIRSVLQTLAGPDPLAEGLIAALRTLRTAAVADEVGLYGRADGARTSCRAFAGPPGASPPGASSSGLSALAEAALRPERADGIAQVELVGARGSRLWVRLPEADPAAVLVAAWAERRAGPNERVLFEDAAHSLLLALDRESAELARRETTALLRSREVQRQFLARLSHELRTPLTAIRGYASSLMQPDVNWDVESQRRFLGRIGSESDRLRRLVDGLLDFSMIESGVLHLRFDWVDLPLVIDAARSCLGHRAAAVAVSCAPDLPAVWADHDRLEQVLMNLMDNAVRHNPPGTTVSVQAWPDGPDTVRIDVSDNGVGLPRAADRASRPVGPRPIGSAASAAAPTAVAGLGLSITHGIVEAHHGTLRHEPISPGTRFVVRLPVEGDTVTRVERDTLTGEVADV
jgi:signal transduction histidine kinase/ABC-type multidrug transport system ATPase subunit